MNEKIIPEFVVHDLLCDHNFSKQNKLHGNIDNKNETKLALKIGMKCRNKSLKYGSPFSYLINFGKIR